MKRATEIGGLFSSAVKLESAASLGTFALLRKPDVFFADVGRGGVGGRASVGGS
jgi:hypothetical protein